MLSEFNRALPLVTAPPAEFSKENGVAWAFSPDRLELSSKPFHLSNCSDSPCVSESGSDVFSKREVEAANKDLFDSERDPTAKAGKRKKTEL
ncbi:hypothetical protein RYX36_010747 [Vicia faba]